MPDLVTHTAAVYFLSRHHSFQRFRAFLYLGTILPDVVSRPIHILFPQFYSYTVAIHTPIFMIFFTLLFGELLQPSIRNAAMKYLGVGILGHFFLDLFQKHLSIGYYWLFPFSWASFEIGLFWPEEPIALIPVWCLLIFSTEVFLQMRKRSRRRFP